METLTIKPKRAISLDDARELWDYRELLFFFTWRDIAVRYKQTAIGVLWVIFQPFVTMVVFSFFFGTVLKVPSDGVPYPIFVYTGLILWQFFSSALTEASTSLITNQAIITKVYFPRMVVPISVTITKFVDLVIMFVMLVVLMAYYGYLPGLMGFGMFFILVLITFFTAVGGGLFLSAVSVKYRDVRYIVPFFMQILMFLTPVIYPVSVAGRYAPLLALNPMTGVIQTARAVLLGTGPVEWHLLGISVAACLALLFVGTIVFKRTERYFADIA